MNKNISYRVKKVLFFEKFLKTFYNRLSKKGDKNTELINHFIRNHQNWKKEYVLDKLLKLKEFEIKIL